MHNLESLHSHTLYSDGILTHQDVLKIAQKYGISVIAFTDHDALPDLGLIEELKALNSPVKWLVGIEMSAGLPAELGGGVDGPHIIGLFVDPTNQALLEHCRKSQEERVNRMHKIVQNLQNLGFEITNEEVMSFTKGKSVGQPHIVMALKSKSKNLQLIEEFKQKMAKAALENPEINKKYQIMIEQGESQYPYALFLGDNSFFPGVKVSYQYWVDFDQSVKLIRDAGGIATIAHYATVKAEIDFTKLEELLKDNRIDGMETVYGLWKYGTGETADITAERDHVKNLVKTYDRIATGGADAHSEKDFAKFTAEEWYSKETIGMLEAILEKKNVNKQWSNLD